MKKTLFILIIVSCISGRTFGQKDTIEVVFGKDEIRDRELKMFESDDILNLSLRFDIPAFKKNKADTVELDAVLTYYISETDSINKDIKIRARGIMRRQYCDMPPIRLNFKKSDSPEDEFGNIDKIKLVTHCRLGNEDILLREYLVYKLYNLFTEYSLKVKLARITYLNTNPNRKIKPVNQFAFLIEPMDAFCKRLDCVELKTQKVTQKSMRPEVMNRMAIFNYMIGNTDWSVPIRHNVIVVAQPKAGRPDLAIVIPYDFDYAGMVNAEYAVPFPNLGIESVRERRYVGVCRTKEEFISALQEFTGKKAEIYKMINEFPYLMPKSKKDIINFLGGFYSGVEKGNAVLNRLLSECLNF